MWFMLSPTGTITYFIPQEKYTIGRKKADIIISNDDSISKNHAEIILKDDKLFIMDVGSKYGTYIGNKKFEVQNEVEIQHETNVKFGLLNSIYKFKKFPINVFTSNLNKTDKTLLNSHINYLKGTLSKEWSENCTHLTVSEVKLTVKVLCALTQGQPIVTVAFWTECIESVKKNQSIPEPDKFSPQINESLLSKNVPLVYKADRKTLFLGKIFVFLTQETMKTVEEIIKITGGKAVLWNKVNLTIDQLKNDTPEYLLIEELRNTDKDSQASQSFSNAIDQLMKVGKRAIPFQEIALAVLYCSCEKNCNTKFDRIGMLVSAETPKNDSEILAPDTEQVTTCSATCSDKIINETQDSMDMATQKLGQASFNKNKENFKNLDSGAGSSGSETEIKNKRMTNSIMNYFKPNQNTVDKVEVANTNGKRELDEPDLNILSKRPKSDIKNVNPFKFKSVKSNEEETVTASDKNLEKNKNSVQQSENPFIKKRKSSEDIEKPSKKPALTNIVNLQENRNNVSTASRSFLSSTKIDDDAPHCRPNISIISSTGWVSRRSKKENTSIVQVKEEPKELDEETLKWRESLKDKIIVEFQNLEVREPSSKCSKSDISINNSQVKNFKKFRKVQPKYIQTHIVPPSEYKVYVCGKDSKSLPNLSDDDKSEESDDERQDSMFFSRKINEAPANKRKFFFNSDRFPKRNKM